MSGFWLALLVGLGVVAYVAVFLALCAFTVGAWETWTHPGEERAVRWVAMPLSLISGLIVAAMFGLPLGMLATGYFHQAPAAPQPPTCRAYVVGGQEIPCEVRTN